MPKFESEEALQAWRDKCAKTRAENKKRQMPKPAELDIGFQDQTTEKKRGRPPKSLVTAAPEPPSPVVNLGAVEEIDSMITALTLVRDILIHTRGLVSA